MKQLMKKDKELYRKMDIRLKNVEEALGKTNSELTQVKHRHDVLVQEVEQIKQYLDINSGLDLKTGMDAKYYTMQQYNERLEEHIKDLSAQLEEARFLLDTTKPYELQKRNKDLEVEIDKLNKRIHNEVGKPFTEECKQVKDLSAKNTELKHEDTISQEKLTTLSSDKSLHEMEQELQSCREIIQAFEHEIKMLQNKTEIQKYESLEQKLHTVKERNEILVYKNYFFEAELERLSTYKEAKENLEHKVKEMKTLQIETYNELEKYKEKTVCLEAEIRNLKAAKLDSDKHLTEIKNLKAALERNVQQLISDRENTIKRLQCLEEHNCSLEIDLKRCNIEINTLSNTIQEVRNQRRKCEEINKTLACEVEQLNLELRKFKLEGSPETNPQTDTGSELDNDIKFQKHVTVATEQTSRDLNNIEEILTPKIQVLDIDAQEVSNADRSLQLSYISLPAERKQVHERIYEPQCQKTYLWTCAPSKALRKQASNILKILLPKNENFQIKFLIVFIFLLKTYIVGTRYEAVLTSTHNLCF